MMLRLLLALLSTTPSFATEPQTVGDWPSVQALLQSTYGPLVASDPWVGVAVGVVMGGEARFYNFGNSAAGHATTEHTVFTINSMTKTFVGTILAEDVVKGRVALTDPVQGLLPGHVIPRQADRQIELLDLATHTSGLPTVPANLIQPNTLDPYRGYTDALFFDFLAGFQIGAIGTNYVYSNLGFGLLGYALAQLDGTTFADLVARRVVAPVGLVETSADPDFAPDLPFAVGHDATGVAQAPRSGPETMAGSWSVKSTAADMVSYLEAYLSPDETTSFGRGLALAQTSTGRVTDAGYTSALGWFVQTSSGMLSKDGAGGGFTSVMFFNPKLRTALVVLSNTADSSTIGVEARAWNVMGMIQP